MDIKLLLFSMTILSLNGVRCQIGMYSQGIYGGFNAGQPQFGGLYNRGFNDYGYAQNLNSNPMSGSRGGGFHNQMPMVAMGLKKQRIEGAEDIVETNIKDERKKPGSFGSRTLFQNKNNDLAGRDGPAGRNLPKEKIKDSSAGNKRKRMKSRRPKKRRSRKMKKKNYESQNLSAILKKGLKPTGHKIKKLSQIAHNILYSG